MASACGPLTRDRVQGSDQWLAGVTDADIINGRHSHLIPRPTPPVGRAVFITP